MLLVHNNLVPRVFKPGVQKTLGARLGSQKQGCCAIQGAVEDFSALLISFEINSSDQHFRPTLGRVLAE